MIGHQRLKKRRRMRVASPGKLNFVGSDESQLHQTFPKGSALGPHRSPGLLVPEVLEGRTEMVFLSTASHPSWRLPRAHSRADRTGLWGSLFKVGGTLSSHSLPLP